MSRRMVGLVACPISVAAALFVAEGTIEAAPIAEDDRRRYAHSEMAAGANAPSHAFGLSAASGESLRERTTPGLHGFLASEVLPALPLARGSAIDLGAGSGTLALRLRALGFDVTAVDANADEFQADVPFVHLNLNDPDFATKVGRDTFDLVTCVEVIEHLESPTGLLRNIRTLLGPNGLALVTTPNVESAPARLKFFVTGQLRMMDAKCDPTHMSPIFLDHLERHYLPAAGLRLVERRAFPESTWMHISWPKELIYRTLARILPGAAVHGDNHIFVLRPEM